MHKILPSLVLIWFLAGCRGNHSQNLLDKTQSRIDSIKKQKVIDSQMALGDRPDGEQEGPNFKEVVGELLKSYNKVEHFDKTVIDGKDTLKLHEIYYCLHDSALSIPKKYVWGGDKTKGFITNNFASKIILTVNKDTVLNKVFGKKDFNSVIYEQLKQNAIILNPNYTGYDNIKNEFALEYSISIPLTDVGVPAYLVIHKEGKYRVLDEYAKMDPFKK